MRLPEKKVLVLVGIIILLVLTNVSALIYALKRSPHVQSGVYQWLNPQLLFVGEPVVNKAAYETFRGNLTRAIEQLEREGRVTEVAVFFRDLNNGPTFNIGADDKFIPASLLKLPLLLTYLSLAEEKPEVLAQELSGESFSFDAFKQYYASTQIVEPNKSYSIEDLLYRLIVYSDNRALELLRAYLDEISPEENLLLETYKDLGIVDAWATASEVESISIKSYASIFRTLYNTSYLSKEFSDKALEYLVGSEFNAGLRKGVPQAIPIAHKFGERRVAEVSQLHDCGIVYYPKNPYLLCVMTKGEDFDALSDAIGIVSKMVYTEFDSRRLR